MASPVVGERPNDLPDDHRVFVPEAAEFLGISTRQLWRIAAAGELRHFKIGKRVQFVLGDLRAYVAKCERPAVKP
jgi:excisionase family DNA binding protein